MKGYSQQETVADAPEKGRRDAKTKEKRDTARLELCQATEMSIAEALKSLATPMRNRATAALATATIIGRLRSTAGMSIARRVAFCQSISRASS